MEQLLRSTPLPPYALPTPCPRTGLPLDVMSGTEVGYAGTRELLDSQEPGPVSYTHLRAHETEADL
eukprot:3053275-Rhodomonas_salina.3